MMIPVTLEYVLWIVRVFVGKELSEFGVTGFNLFGGCPTVIGEIEAASVLDGPINDALKVLPSLFSTVIGTFDVKVAHDADGRFFGP